MKKLKNIPNSKIFISFISFFLLSTIFVTSAFVGDVFAQQGTNVAVKQGELGFKIPDFATILTFAIRLFFIVAGIAALAYGLWGAVSWVMSGGEQENIEKARNKIVAAIVGVILVVVVLALIVTMEQFVFQQRVCFGLSCPVVVPGILEACVPNPQYGKSVAQFDDLDNLNDPLGGDSITIECCPDERDETQKAKGVRITTGWHEDTDNFGNYDYKICCTKGDTNGDQICDEL